MRFSLALCLALAACHGTSTPVTGHALVDDAGCQVGCDKCPIGSTCISAPYQPVCLAPCTSDGDCATGDLCAALDLPGYTLSPVCVSPAMPMLCEPRACSVAPRCQDATTLLRPLPKQYDGKACGWEVVPCVSSCDAATAQCT
jgi:hypothetical protein